MIGEFYTGAWNPTAPDYRRPPAIDRAAASVLGTSQPCKTTSIPGGLRQTTAAYSRPDPNVFSPRRFGLWRLDRRRCSALCELVCGCRPQFGVLRALVDESTQIRTLEQQVHDGIETDAVPCLTQTELIGNLSESRTPNSCPFWINGTTISDARRGIATRYAREMHPHPER